MIYCATCVHVTDFMPPSTEQKSTPIRPTTQCCKLMRQTSHDQAYTRHLGNQIGKGADDGSDDTDYARKFPPYLAPRKSGMV